MLNFLKKKLLNNILERVAEYRKKFDLLFLKKLIELLITHITCLAETKGKLLLSVFKYLSNITLKVCDITKLIIKNGLDFKEILKDLLNLFKKK